MAVLELFSAASCPFAHRTRLVLQEKNAPFTLREIDLKNKPEDFIRLSPQGRVPLLCHDGGVIFESTVIGEYLDEIFPSPPLKPARALARAQMRIWVDHANTVFVKQFYRLMGARGEPNRSREAAAMGECLAFMEREGLGKNAAAPYWLGSDPTLADFAYYPFFERWAAIAEYGGLALPGELTRLNAWLAAMKGRASVKALAREDAFYVAHYKDYS